MGVSFSGLITGETISMHDLTGKTLAVDAFNMLYQFITTIRGPDGAPLTDRKGNITSHLVGLFGRVTKLMGENITLIFVFDGEAPKLKKAERERRAAAKADAQAKYEEAVEAEDTESMAKYAGRTARLTKKMLDEAKQLLRALGIPVVEAPSEGEAQAAHLVKKGDAWGLISQDYDCLLFGTDRMIKNLSVTARKRTPGTLATTIVEPEILTLTNVLNTLGINHEQLINLGMLIGTDFNIGGIKGIGPKKGLKLVKEHPDPETLFAEAGWDFPYPWEEVRDVFTTLPVTDDYTTTASGIDANEVKRILIDEHDFSQTRVETVLARLIKQGKDRAQKGLGDYF